MARDFDGVDDKIDFGFDASINDFAQKTILIHADTDANETLVSKGTDTALATEGWTVRIAAVVQSNLHYFQAFSLTDGEWRADQAVGDNQFGVTYDRGSSNNDPTLYVDAGVPASIETMMPTGNSDTDADQNLRLGATNDDAVVPFYDGRLSHFVYDSTLFTAAQVNRHRWWGVAPGGPSTVDVWHPMWTDSLVNKGTATANGTATGTTMASLPRVERMWGSCMGVGR